MLASLICAVLTCGAASNSWGASGEDNAQPADDGPAGLRVFLDCGRDCDRDYLRREITFVNYVRDRRDAEVHVLVTDERSGGGTQYTLDFIGLEQFAGNDVRHTYSESRTDTDDETRVGIAQVLRVGFLHYIIETPLATEIEIGTARQGNGARSVMVQPDDDPWNFWVYRLSSNIRVSGEDTRTSRNFNGSASANRTTEDWIIRTEVDGSYNESVTALSSGDFTNISTRYNVDGQVVKSLGEHWGASIAGRAGASTFLNQDLRLRVQPGIEYNVFPYSESSRRSLTFSYQAGVESFKYEEETLFGKLEETVPAQQVQATLDVEQPWGDGRIRMNYNSLLNDLDTHSASVSGNLSFRVARGLSLNVSASTSLVRDQIYLPAENLSDEEILLQRRQLATDSRYRVSFGFSYTFGSIFNNVVNPRF